MFCGDIAAFRAEGHQFDVGLGLHCCGNSTDQALAACVEAGAAGGRKRRRPRDSTAGSKPDEGPGDEGPSAGYASRGKAQRAYPVTSAYSLEVATNSAYLHKIA